VLCGVAPGSPANEDLVADPLGLPGMRAGGAVTRPLQRQARPDAFLLGRRTCQLLHAAIEAEPVG
jgi:hypothetical protein